MKAGKLRHRVAIEIPIDTVSSGAVTRTWNSYDTAWASIEPLYGREYWEAAKLNSEITAKIVMRWRRGITPQMRCTYGPRTFEIISIIDDLQLNRELRLMVKEERIT